MHILTSYLALVLLLHPAVPRLFHSLPEDTYAFPKFRVEFLNSLPVLNETAERWLTDGLLGGELEFLEQSRKFFSYPLSSDPRAIGSGPSESQGEGEIVDVGVLEAKSKMYLQNPLPGFDSTRRIYSRAFETWHQRFLCLPGPQTSGQHILSPIRGAI